MAPSQVLVSRVSYLAQFPHDEKHPEERQGTTWELGIPTGLSGLKISCKQGRNPSPRAPCDLYTAFQKTWGEFLRFAGCSLIPKCVVPPLAHPQQELCPAHSHRRTQPSCTPGFSGGSSAQMQSSSDVASAGAGCGPTAGTAQLCSPSRFTH